MAVKYRRQVAHAFMPFLWTLKTSIFSISIYFLFIPQFSHNHITSQFSHHNHIISQFIAPHLAAAVLKDSSKFGPFFWTQVTVLQHLDHTMADRDVIRVENPTQYHGTKQGWEDHVHQQNLKKGIERLDRRSGNPNKGAVKKHGHGGKFTVDGPYNNEDYADPVPAAMDKNDPNYVDPSEEQADMEAGISTVEVAKVEETGAGTAHPAS